MGTTESLLLFALPTSIDRLLKPAPDANDWSLEVVEPVVVV